MDTNGDHEQEEAEEAESEGTILQQKVTKLTKRLCDSFGVGFRAIVENPFRVWEGVGAVFPGR